MIRGEEKWSKIVTRWYPREGKRKRGRPEKKWDDDIRQVAGVTWNRVAQDRREWKRRCMQVALSLRSKAQQVNAYPTYIAMIRDLKRSRNCQWDKDRNQKSRPEEIEIENQGRNRV
ncbi:hypothetical protein EVAR_17310_1 [Eumeta japonica]|uniref:Uncharacterized protein n=1 Tax=Eumeta variegata TaxID=151549 RepID=A0A4C1TT48_EUMVA|nr:hypothetical protein EVAR_17310_1 [Eumeta japonica]